MGRGCWRTAPCSRAPHARGERVRGALAEASCPDRSSQPYIAVPQSGASRSPPAVHVSRASFRPSTRDGRRGNGPVKPRTKFLVGGLLILGSAGYLMASSIKETGQYYLTPGELAAKVKADPTFVENGVKVGARVVPGSIKRDPGGRSVSFQMTDGAQTYAVAYRGIAPDTFADGVDVIVEGRLQPDG